MLRYLAVVLIAATLGFRSPDKPVSTSGTWQVDTLHSDAKLTTDGTTDFGKTTMNVVLGFGRVNGEINLDDADPAKSRVDLRIYPATSMSETIAEDANFRTHWLANLANQTLLCFHSTQVTRTSDGNLQVTGELKVTSVDRNVQLDPTEAYSGPVYGPPTIHSVSRPATFVFDLAAGDAESTKISGSTAVTRQGFPQLLRAVVNTYWPPLVEDANCQTPASFGEDYRGVECTGTVLQPPPLPQGPYAGAREDYPGPSDYNAVSGNELTIKLHMRLVQKDAAETGTAAE